MTPLNQQQSEWPPRLVVCVGSVVLKGSRALFVRQASGHPLEGQWSIPWGLVDSGETPEAAALRETREESGIKAEIEGLLGIQNLQQEGWIALVFLCCHLRGEPVPDGGVETDSARYFSLEEMVNFTEPFDPWCWWVVRRVLLGDYDFIPPKPENPYKPRLAFF